MRPILTRVGALVAVCAVLGTVMWAAQPAEGTPATRTEPVPLATGCNNVALTWPTGSSPAEVVESVAPTSVVAMWKWDNAAQAFRGYAPLPGAPNDFWWLRTLDPAFLCVDRPATLIRPLMIPAGP